METNNNQVSIKKKTPWYKSPWIIGWIALVLIVLSVNIYMVSQSILGFSGLVVDDFYNRGQYYEENMHKKLANNTQWTAEFKLQEIRVHQPASIFFNLKDKQGNRVKLEKTTLFAYRPSDAKKDFSVPMQFDQETQSYQAKLTFELKGKWDLIGSAMIDETEVNYGKEIFVKD